MLTESKRTELRKLQDDLLAVLKRIPLYRDNWTVPITEGWPSCAELAAMIYPRWESYLRGLLNEKRTEVCEVAETSATEQVTAAATKETKTMNSKRLKINRIYEVWLYIRPVEPGVFSSHCEFRAFRLDGNTYHGAKPPALGRTWQSRQYLGRFACSGPAQAIRGAQDYTNATVRFMDLEIGDRFSLSADGRVHQKVDARLAIDLNEGKNDRGEYVTDDFALQKRFYLRNEVPQATDFDATKTVDSSKP